MKKRADGRYRGKLLVGVVDGKQIYKYVYGKTKKQVDEKLAQLRVELGKGADLTQPMTFSFWVDRWLKREEQRQTANWFDVCRARASLWRDCLGDADVSKITTADLEAVLIDLQKRNPKTGKPSAKKTLIEYRNIISRIFAYIAQNRAISFDPTKFLSVDRNAPATRRTAVATAVVQKMIETEDEIRVPCLIMAYAGLRLGEVAALTWSDIDLKNNLIKVNKSWEFKTQSLKEPKTAAGIRTVPIPPPLASVLAEAPRTALLVCGRTLTIGIWKNALDRYNKKLGTVFSAHMLRHTCATMYYEAGIDVLTAQKWLGHADPSTTIKIYTHLREEKEMLNIIHLQDYFGGENSKKIHHQNGRGSEGGQDTPKTLGI